MINWEENQIVFCRSTDFLKEEKNLLIQLKEKSGKDLIIDCSLNILPLKSIKFIETFQRNSNYCFVIIIPLGMKHSYPSEWVVVPTKKEALDFIAYEQMQRDLGI